MTAQQQSADRTQVTPSNFHGVLRHELSKLRKTKKREAIEDPIAAAHEADLSGLAFSGGGIRSATFNLGVLQALARLGLLEKFDYLSTVSGGGYIGSWLAAWIQRSIEEDKKEIQVHDSQPSRSETQAAADSTAPPNPPLAIEISTEDNKGSVTGAVLHEQIIKKKADEEKEKPVPAADPAEVGFQKVIAELQRSAGTSKHKDVRTEPRTIAHLREYSNYLTPRKGLWSTDTWTLAVAYLRNFLLTVSVLIGTLGAVVLFTRAAAISYALILTQGSWIPDLFVYGLLAISLSGAAFFAAMDLRRCRVHPEAECSKATSVCGIVCTVFACWMGGAYLWRTHEVFFAEGNRMKTIWYFLGTLAIVSCMGLVGRSQGAKKTEKRALWQDTKRILAAVGATVVFFLAAWGLCGWFDRWTQTSIWLPSPFWLATMFAPALMLTCFTLFAAVFVGLAGQDLEELEREWMARLLSSVTKWTLVFGFLTIAAISVPLVLDGLNQEALNYSHGILGLLWAAISSAGAWIGRKGKETGTGVGRALRKVVVAVAPAIFIAGLLFILISGLDGLTRLIQFHSEGRWTVWQLSFAGPQILVGLLLITLLVSLITLLWSWRVGVNAFSLHALYGNRLVRAYLGASNTGRHAHPFINFDADDSKVRMADLVPQENGYRGPYLLVNAAINLAHASRLAWQQRKAGAFLFSPLYCGYEFPEEQAPGGQSAKPIVRGYVPSQIYADGKRSTRGISLGKAMTISGAAASPNMGYRTSPALAFLMTVFNVRLGWWLPNTAVRPPDDPHARWWERKRLLPVLDWLGLTSTGHLRKKGPSLGLSHLLLELLGLTDIRHKYVYVSDGGHFENLGLYELVRRRCRHIVVCDAEEDANMGFGGLGLAIERCRTDLGIPIEIDVSQLRKNPETGLSRWHCAVGRIRYGEADQGQRDGTLLYLKASLIGDEPQDITSYATGHARFPHESTGDQWFDEVQFESYRALGQHIANKVLSTATQVVRRNQTIVALGTRASEQKEIFLRELFAEIGNQWYPHAGGPEKQIGDHDALLDKLIETLRNDPLLAFLDWQLYPDLGGTVRNARLKHRPVPWVPIGYDELRAGFFFCRRLLQFMQQVYHERGLDTSYDAPSHRGWMNLFQRWSFSRMVRYTWSMSAGCYSKRFQTFCAHHLRLEVGELSWAKKPLEVKAIDAEFLPKPDADRKVPPPEECTADQAWSRAEREHGLDFFETLLMREYLRLYWAAREPKPVKSVFKIYPLTIATDDPTQTSRKAFASITAGFAIVREERSPEGKSTLLYLRIRPALRHMGLAHKAIKVMIGSDPPLTSQVSEESIASMDPTKERWHRRIFLELYPEQMEAVSNTRQYLAQMINREIEKYRTQFQNKATAEDSKTEAKNDVFQPHAAT